MKPTFKMLGKSTAVLCFCVAMMPVISLAQNRPQAGDGTGTAGSGGGGLGGPIAPMLQAVRQLNLPADELHSIRSVIRQTAGDVRDAASGLQQDTPQQRIEKMKDVQKILSDARDKVLGMLTPEQKTKYFPLFAKALVKQAIDRVKAIQKGSSKLEISDDERSQLKSLFDDDLKSLDGYETDADAVTDEPGATDLQEKIGQLTKDTRRQLVSILGQDDVRQLMQNMRAVAQGTGAGNNRDTADDAAPAAPPTTKPVAK